VKLPDIGGVLENEEQTLWAPREALRGHGGCAEGYYCLLSPVQEASRTIADRSTQIALAMVIAGLLEAV